MILPGCHEDMKTVFGRIDIMDKTLYHYEIMDTFTMTRRDNVLTAHIAEPDVLSGRSC